MGKSRRHDAVETTPELSFVRAGALNLIVYTHKDSGDKVRVPVDSDAFLDDKRLVRTSTMDQVTFQRHCTFKLTLEFTEALPCMEETAVRESTDWVLCSCDGSSAFYSKVEERLVLQHCVVCVLSNVEALAQPFVAVLRRDEDEWLLERLLR